jgi:YD repeat-containing protein
MTRLLFWTLLALNPLLLGAWLSVDETGRLRMETVYDEQGRPTRERSRDERGRVLRDDEVFEDGSRRSPR